MKKILFIALFVMAGTLACNAQLVTSRMSTKEKHHNFWMDINLGSSKISLKDSNEKGVSAFNPGLSFHLSCPINNYFGWDAFNIGISAILPSAENHGEFIGRIFAQTGPRLYYPITHKLQLTLAEYAGVGFGFSGNRSLKVHYSNDLSAGIILNKRVMFAFSWESAPKIYEETVRISRNETRTYISNLNSIRFKFAFSF